MKIKLIYGISIAVAIVLVNSFFIDITGVESDSMRTLFVYSPLVILAIGLFLAMKKIKVKIYNSDLNFGQAIYSGISICIVVAFCYSILNFFYFEYINKSYAEEDLKKQISEIQKKYKDPKEIEENVAKAKEYALPKNGLIGSFVFILISGIAISAISSSILRTKDTFTEIAKKRE
jgi:hypothetical protein